MSNLIRTLIFLLAIPLIGYLVASGILWDINRQAGLPEGVTIEMLCESPRALAASADLGAACGEIVRIQTLQHVSLWCLLIGAGLPLLAFAGARYAGRNRDRLARIFRLLVTTQVLILSGLVLAEAVILAFSAYEAESYLIHRVYFVVIGAVAIGGLLAAIKLVTSAFSFTKAISTTVIGKRLTRQSAPRLFDDIQAIAASLDARAPDNVVVGLDPTFFATSAEVRLVGEAQPLTGETLFLSVPLTRIFNLEELRSVIGHELGHFSGKDTAYSLRFAPVYAGLGSSLEAVGVSENDGTMGIAKLPALALLSYIYGLFQVSESAVSRDRELAADTAGARAGSPLALSSALCKLSIYSNLWEKVQHQSIQALGEGEVTHNLARLFADSARYDVESSSLPEMLAAALEVRIAHPTDSHPPVAQRLDALRITVDQVKEAGLALPAAPASSLFDHAEALEAELTAQQREVLVAAGHVRMPEKPANTDVERAIYQLIVTVIRADGRIEASEVLTAETIGQQMLPASFKPLAFRETCAHLPGDFDPVPVAKALGELITTEGRAAVLACLRAVAAADGETAPAEAALIQSVEEAMTAA